MLCAFFLYIYFCVPIKSLTFLFARIFLLLTLAFPPSHYPTSNISPANLMVYIGAQNNIENIKKKTQQKKKQKRKKEKSMRVEQCRLISNDVSVNRHINFQSVLYFFFCSYSCVFFVVGFRVDFSFFFFGSRRKARKKKKS